MDDGELTDASRMPRPALTHLGYVAAFVRITTLKEWAVYPGRSTIRACGEDDKMGCCMYMKGWSLEDSHKRAKSEKGSLPRCNIWCCEELPRRVHFWQRATAAQGVERRSQDVMS